MLDATWRWFGFGQPDNTSAQTGATARTGGGGDNEPVLIAVIQGPIAGEMAREALIEANIPAMVRRKTMGEIYGLTLGDMGASEVWVPPALAEQALAVLIGIGVVEEE